MELQSISEVSKKFNISTRTLRYYEQIGLIQPTEREDFSYRTYNIETILRLKQIIVLRKLRIPLKQITNIIKNENVALLIEAFEKNLNEIEDEITALSTIKSVIQTFIIRINTENVKLQLLDDESLLEIVDSITVSKINFKEDKTMDDLSKATEKTNKLADKDVRIIYLPPATVASAHCIGGPAEWNSGNLIREFIKNSNLPKIKPDFRHYGFNHPNGTNNGGPCDDHGYERWVTIPDDMEVCEPLTKKHFNGGLYAAHMIPIGAFEEWEWLWQWVDDNKKYDRIAGSPECMDGLIEEHLNVINNYMLSSEELDKVLQLDLLIPIKEKK